MSTGQSFKITLESLDDTDAFARKLGSMLRGGEVIELIGDVGAGKTTFTKGLVAGLESGDHVTSPTFTVTNVYAAGRLPVYHFDFYRLGADDQMIKHELAQTSDEPNAVIVLEWAQDLQNVLPEDHVTIHISTISEDIREFAITIPEPLSYLELT